MTQNANEQGIFQDRQMIIVSSNLLTKKCENFNWFPVRQRLIADKNFSESNICRTILKSSPSYMNRPIDLDPCLISNIQTIILRHKSYDCLLKKDINIFFKHFLSL